MGNPCRARDFPPFAQAIIDSSTPPSSSSSSGLNCTVGSCLQRAVMIIVDSQSQTRLCYCLYYGSTWLLDNRASVQPTSPLNSIHLNFTLCSYFSHALFLHKIYSRNIESSSKSFQRLRLHHFVLTVTVKLTTFSMLFLT